MTVAAPPRRGSGTCCSIRKVMGGCVPGMKSIEVVSDTEYMATMHVKISFISAKFKLRTTIVEQRTPHYLRAKAPARMPRWPVRSNSRARYS